MTVTALNASDHDVTAAVQLASARTGVDFDYLYTQAKVESGLRPDAAAATSSARGLYQFTSATWLDTVGRHGSAHGLAWAADAVTSGEATRDPAIRAAVLALRGDPQASALMAGAFAADNAAKLEAGLGRPANATALYLAHFLGAAGAVRFIQAMDAAPDTAAAAIMPAAAAANRDVFFAADGRPRSLAAVYDRFAARFGRNIVPAPGTELPVRANPWSPPAAASLVPAPQAARLAYLLLAELGA